MDLDGNGKFGSQGRHGLGLVGNDDEPPAGAAHDLLLKLGRSTTLDAIEVRIHFVGPVEIQVELPVNRRIAEIPDRQTFLLAKEFGVEGRGDHQKMRQLARPEELPRLFDRPEGRAARPQAQFHPRLDQIEDRLVPSRFFFLALENSCG